MSDFHWSWLVVGIGVALLVAALTVIVWEVL